MNKCIKCGSEKVVEGRMTGIANIIVKKGYHKLLEAFQEGFQPDNIICLNCGHIEFVVAEEDLKKLVEHSS